MKIMTFLKNSNRTLLEMHSGILVVGILCQIVGSFFVKDQAMYAGSLWFGILLAMVSAVHMFRSLNRALDTVKSASRLILRDYMIRYVLIVIILLIIITTGVFNPLIVFMAYMSLKVTALIQPLTHKVLNKIFHETDPVPTAMPPDPPLDDQEDLMLKEEQAQ